MPLKREPVTEKNKRQVSLKISRRIDDEIRKACKLHRIDYINVVEWGADRAARVLLKNTPLDCEGHKTILQNMVT
jgi:hypothetical protein